MKVGVFLPNWIGDVVMATPTLRAVRKHFGQEARMIGVMRPYVADVVAGLDWFDEELYYDPKSRDSELRGWNLARRLRERRFDVTLLLTNSFRSAWWSLIGMGKNRIGYGRYGRDLLLSEALLPPMRDGKLARHPMVDYYLELAYSVGCPPESPRLELATTAGDERAANIVWSKLGLRDPSRVVAFNSSGAFGGAKLWPTEHFAALARRVATNLDYDVLVLCGPSEREIAADVVRRASHPRVTSLANEPLSIGLSKACVRRTRLMVTTDSGPRHFAVAFGVPTIGLYGPTPPVWGHNPTAKSLDLQVELDCLGCHERTCPLGHHKCMRDLSVDRVYRAVAAELHGGREAAAA